MNSSPTTLQMLLGLYGYLVPILLYVMWSTLALYDLGRRDDLRTGALWVWAGAIFLVPFGAAVLYLLVGGSRLSSQSRMIGVLGGAGVYAVVLALAGALSSG